MSKPKIEELEEEIKKLKEPKRKILWQNTNPSSEMGADTIINLSSSDYDELIWFYIFSNSAGNLKNQQSLSCQKGCTITLFTIGYSSNATVRRTIVYISDTQYKAAVGKRDTNDEPNCCIPVAVVGIKY